MHASRSPQQVPDTAKLLAELDCQVTGWRPRHAALQREFEQAVDPILELLSTRGTMSGHHSFGIVQNLTRATSDVVAAFHLFVHGYLNQAYGVLRSAFEACDLVELFAEKPEEATLWIDGDKTHREFRPSTVRRKLGKQATDDVYSHLCEMGAHPRFPGARLMGKIAVPVDPGDGRPVTHIRIGPGDLDGPEMMLGMGFVLQAIVLVGIRCSALHGVHSGISERALVQTLRRIADPLIRAAALVKEELDGQGFEETEFLAVCYEPLVRIADEWMAELA